MRWCSLLSTWPCTTSISVLTALSTASIYCFLYLLTNIPFHICKPTINGLLEICIIILEFLFQVCQKFSHSYNNTNKGPHWAYLLPGLNFGFVIHQNSLCTTFTFCHIRVIHLTPPNCGDLHHNIHCQL